MTRKEFLEYCLDTYGTEPDYPFTDDLKYVPAVEILQWLVTHNFLAYDKSNTELEIKTSLQIALADIYAYDVELYSKLLDFACEERQKQTKDGADDTFFFFRAFLLYNYNARYHSEDFIMHYDAILLRYALLTNCIVKIYKKQK